MAMEESNYETYKRNLWRKNKRKNDFHTGKLLIIVGIALFLYALILIPFHVKDVHEMAGEELKPGRTYSVQKLRIFSAKTDDTGKKIIAVAGFYDKDNIRRLFSFTADADEEISREIISGLKSTSNTNYTTDCYVTVEHISDETDSYFYVFGKKYAGGDESSMLALNAKYLCDIADNYILRSILNAGFIRGALILGVIGLVYGGILYLKNRKYITEGS